LIADFKKNARARYVINDENGAGVPYVREWFVYVGTESGNAILTSKTRCELTIQNEPTDSAFPEPQEGFRFSANKKVAPTNPPFQLP